MWKYQHPDFALFLLGELQKQQQGSVFCDTFLQTEGVCVPAHSCVLAAFSPVFSRILSSSPAPHAGQNRLLNLEAVGSHALLKLVGFLYTGEMEIESQSEHERIMSAALRLGLRSLFEKKRVLVEKDMLDTSVQTEDCTRSQESEIVPEPLKELSSTATSVQPCGLLDHELPPSVLFDEGFNLINKVTGLSLTDLTEASVSNHQNTKAKKRWKMSKRESQHKRLTRQQNQMKVVNVEGTKSDQTGMVERSRRVSGKDFRKLLEKTGQKEAKLDQLKVKIKLRRRRGTCWESNLLVSVQGESEKAEEVKECAPQSQSCPSGTLSGQSLGTLTPPTDLPISPSNSSTHGKCLHTPLQASVSSPLDVPALSSSPAQADESDEHIAMLLEDMFMMGLNILPLIPLERNLDDQEQLAPLREPKGGQRGSDASTQNPCLFVQSAEPEMRKSDVTKTTAPSGSSGERDEGFRNQSSTDALESPGKSSSNTVKNLETVTGSSEPSLVEGLFLTSIATAVSDHDVMACMPFDMPDFKLLRCLSPLHSDSDVPTQDPSKPSHVQDPETHNHPLWLSKSLMKLDFPLNSMIESSCPRSQHDLIACQNRSSPDLAEKQELKTSFSQYNLTSGSSSNLIQPDASEQPEPRKTRSRRLATQRSKASECQNPKNEAKVQSRKSKCDYMPNSNARRVSARITNANRKVAAGVKRTRDVSSPHRKKKAKLKNDRTQREHVDVVPKPKFPGAVKSRRGRLLKSRSSDENLSVQANCEGGKTKTDEFKQGKPNTRQEKDSKEMEEADFNNNSEQTRNSQTKGPSVLDQIFHQSLLRSSHNVNQRRTSGLGDSSFWLQKFGEGQREDENVKLAANSGGQIDKGICALENNGGLKKAFDNQTRLSSVKDGDITTEKNLCTTDAVVLNIDCRYETKDQMIEISAQLPSEKDIMMPVDDHVMSHTKKNSVVTRNEPTVIETILSINSHSEQDLQQICGEEEDSGTNEEVEMIEETEDLRAHEFVKERALLASDDICWETTSGWDEDDEDHDINVEVYQCRAETTDDQTPLEYEELIEGHIAAPIITDVPAIGVLRQRRNTQEITSRDAPSVQTSLRSPNVRYISDSNEDSQPDEEDIEVDVEESVDSPLGLSAAEQIVTLVVESPLDREGELDDEEEEVDVTGEETD